MKRPEGASSVTAICPFGPTCLISTRPDAMIANDISLTLPHQDLAGIGMQGLQVGSQCRKVLSGDIGEHIQRRQLLGASGAHASPLGSPA
jgi:hypothetical protein